MPSFGNFGGRLTGAAGAAYNAFRIFYSNPSLEQTLQAYRSRHDYYLLLWRYYNNAIWDRAEANWSVYASRKNLYRNTRSIYNPVRRLVDFYASQIYPGVLSEDGEELPEGVPLAIPFADDTDPLIKSGISQLWQWSNWQSKKAVIVKWAAAIGSVLIEVEDDVEKGKVYLKPVWPGLVVDLNLDHSGNIKQYVIEYPIQDEKDSGIRGGMGNTNFVETHIFRKEVDEISFRYYRDGEPWDWEGNGAVVENPYGFVPAVWINHIDVGSSHGQPAFQGSYTKLDEINAKASQINDYIGRVIASPNIITSGASGGLSNMSKNTTKRGNTDDFTDAGSDTESMLFLTAPQGTDVKFLTGNLNIADAYLPIDRMLAEIEADNPEITFWSKLREMSQVTGPGAQALVGDVIALVQEAAASYDRGCTSLFQMALAIAGYRANAGDWGDTDMGGMTAQRKKFLPFSLDSYAAGDLDFTIQPRTLLKTTKLQDAQEKLAFWTGVKAATDAGAPLISVLQADGWAEEQIADFQAQRDVEDAASTEKIAKAQALFQAASPESPLLLPGKAPASQGDNTNPGVSQ